MKKKKMLIALIAIMNGIILALIVIIIGLCINRTKQKNVSVRETESQTETTGKEDEPVQKTKTDKTGKVSKNEGKFYGQLHVKGADLCDKKGESVQLRGLSTHGLAWFPEYVNASFIKELHEKWNVNVIRLAMYTAESGGYCTDGDQNKLKKLVDDGVKYATDENMYVIIDWHILSDKDPNMNRDEAEKFFEEMSEKYADHDNVIYEICNEPNGGTSWQDIKKYAEDIIAVIRKHDKNNIILVGTPNWSQHLDEAVNDPVKDQENIMYTLHFYAATHKEELRKTLKDAHAAGLPVFVSEYGICEASGNGTLDLEQAEKWIDLMDSENISYAGWSIANKDEACSLFLPDCKKTSGFTIKDLTDSGRWQYAMLTGDKKALLKEQKKAASGNGTTAGGVRGIETGNPKLKPKLSLANSWESEGKKFYQYKLDLENLSSETIRNWTVDISFRSQVQLTECWGVKCTIDNRTLHMKAVEYNQQISANATVSDIGFIVSVEEKK